MQDGITFEVNVNYQNIPGMQTQTTIDILQINSQSRIFWYM